MKTLGNLLMIVIGMLFLVPKVSTIEKVDELNQSIIKEYEEPTELANARAKVEMVKQDIKITQSEIELQLTQIQTQ